MSEALIVGLVAASAAVLGAVAGALGSILTQLINAGAERRQEKLRLAVQLALSDYEHRMQALTSNLLPPGQRVPPLAAYLDYHTRLLAMIDQGPLTPEGIVEFYSAHHTVKAAIDDAPPYVVPRERP